MNNKSRGRHITKAQEIFSTNHRRKFQQSKEEMPTIEEQEMNTTPSNQANRIINLLHHVIIHNTKHTK